MRNIYAILLACLVSACAPTDYIIVDQASHEITPNAPVFTAQTETMQIKKIMDQRMGDIPGVRIVALGDSVSVMISSDAMFAVGTSSMADDVSSDLLPFVEVAAQYDDSFVKIEVFTDSSGREVQNEKLSQERAKAIAGYFMIQGVMPSRIVIKGYGAMYPIAPNDTTENKALNRRIVLTLDVPQLKPPIVV